MLQSDVLLHMYMRNGSVSALENDDEPIERRMIKPPPSRCSRSVATRITPFGSSLMAPTNSRPRQAASVITDKLRAQQVR